MKAQISFTMKGIYLIIILITIAIVLNQVASFYSMLSEQEKTLDLREEAMNILEKLSSSKECLAYEEKGNIQNQDFYLSTHRIIDARKLEQFSSEFEEVQPTCTKSFDFGYRITIETFPINLSSLQVTTKSGVFEKILKLIDGKNTTFVLDVSGSMSGSGGNCDIELPKNTKICCLKLFMYNFIDKLSDKSRIAAIPYGDNTYCNPQLLFPFTKLDGTTTRNNLKNLISTLHPIDSTPMSAGLKKGYEYSINNYGQAIVLLTDGCENECMPPTSKEIANQYKTYDIPVYTVAYGSAACIQPLQDIAEISGGEFFDARTCEELVSERKETLNLSLNKMIWTFGDKKFSEKDALKEILTTSLPVVVYINKTTFLPGKMEITIVNGELEKLKGFIEQSCFTGIDFEKKIFIHYPVYLKTSGQEKFLCMNIESKEVCQKISCKKTITFEGIENPGEYTFNSLNKGNELEIMV